MADRIVVVIPTRNRADFAERAVAAVLASAPAVPVSVLVSDNSTVPEQAERLGAFCAERAGGAVDVRYVRPGRDLSMSEHWEWARLQAKDSAASHCLFLTDRSVLKPHALAALAAVSASHPDDVVTYEADEVSDRSTPVSLRLARTCGALLAVRSARLLYLSSQLIVVTALPRMLNSLVPVAAFDRLEQRYGSVFDSLAPDFCFCFRLLASVERILYLDQPLLTMYGTARSNGASVASGVVTRDGLDFLRRAEEQGGLLAGTSLPAVSTTYAVIAKEYARAAAERPAAVLPALNIAAYLCAVTLQTESFAAGQLREDNIAALRKEGVRFGRGARRRRQLAQAAHYLRVLRPGDFLVQSAVRVLARRPVSLPDTESAIAWAATHPRRASSARLLGYLRGTTLSG